MVKFTADRKGRKLIGLGISSGNVARLKEGDAIYIRCDELGVPGVDVSIFYGETEQLLYEAVRSYISPETKLHIDPKLDMRMSPCNHINAVRGRCTLEYGHQGEHQWEF